MLPNVAMMGVDDVPYQRREIGPGRSLGALSRPRAERVQLIEDLRNRDVLVSGRFLERSLTLAAVVEAEALENWRDPGIVPDNVRQPRVKNGS